MRRQKSDSDRAIELVLENSPFLIFLTAKQLSFLKQPGAWSALNLSVGSGWNPGRKRLLYAFWA